MSEAEHLTGLPRRPVSEVEWEELLLRVELMPRALGVVMEDVDPETAEVRCVVDEMVEREQWASRFLEHAVGIGPARTVGDLDGSRVVRGEAGAVDRFVRYRQRNFAIVQRRGIDVWEWEGPGTAPGRATVYQLLAHLARRDVAALAALRLVSNRSRIC